jgi:hypothetical protein
MIMELSNIKENALPWWILGIFFRKIAKQSNKILITLTADRVSQPIPASKYYSAWKYFYWITKLEFVTLNASTGPIYIGKDAEIMEGSVIRGPLHSVTCCRKISFKKIMLQLWEHIQE